MDNSIQIHMTFLDTSIEERYGGPGLFHAPSFAVPLKFIKIRCLKIILVRKTWYEENKEFE